MSLIATSILTASSAPLMASTAAMTELQVQATSLLQGLQIEMEPFTQEEAIGRLHQTLSPLHGRDEQVDSLSLPQQSRADFNDFLSAEEASAVPTGQLLTDLQERVEPLRAALAAVSVTAVIRDGAMPDEPTAPRKPLAYEPRHRAEALAAKRDQVHGAIARLFRMAEARSGVRVAEVPPALSLDYALAHPAEFQDRPLEIVLFDIDDTTRRGQMYLEWAIKDVFRYGPKSSAGIKWWRVLWYALIKGIGLRKQEKEHGHADEDKTRAVVAGALKGLDLEKVEASLDRFYEVFGKRGIVPYMREEFAYHRSEGRLIIGLSASPEYLVRKHAEDIGIPPENVFGTIVDVVDGEVKFTLLRSDEKIVWLKEQVLDRLEEAGISYKITHAYSDSDSDTPMFELTRKNGGVVVSTNAPREAFEQRVLTEMDGVAVQEEGNTRSTILFHDAEAGQLVHRETIPPIPFYWQDDLKAYARVAGRSAAAFALAMGLATAVIDLSQGGWGAVHVGSVIADGGLAALGGGLGAAGAHFVTPKSGPVSGRRRWLMEYSTPLAVAMMFAGTYPEVVANTSGVPGMALVLGAVLAAAGLTQTITGSFRTLSRGLAWQTDRVARGIAGETLMRTAEVSLFHGLSLALYKGGDALWSLISMIPGVG